MNDETQADEGKIHLTHVFFTVLQPHIYFWHCSRNTSVTANINARSAPFERPSKP